MKGRGEICNQNHLSLRFFFGFEISIGRLNLPLAINQTTKTKKTVELFILFLCRGKPFLDISKVQTLIFLQSLLMWRTFTKILKEKNSCSTSFTASMMFHKRNPKPTSWVVLNKWISTPNDQDSQNSIVSPVELDFALELNYLS